MAAREIAASQETFACSLLPATAPRPGAIAILQLCGDVEPVLAALTGTGSWPIGRARLVSFAGVDEGLAVRLGDRVAQLMPHGGQRVVQRLIEWLVQRGVAIPDAAPPPEAVYPEAEDRLEALTLGAVARSASPLAIDLLLDQPRRWRREVCLDHEARNRSLRLNRLIDPPLVAVAGPANVGKSTLSNTLLGRSMSITADLPGTTRDYTSGRIDLGGLVVDWHDTPGLRQTRDPIELKAVELARRLLAGADFVIAMTDAAHEWPDLPRKADLRLGSKADVAGRDDADLSVSAITGEGLAELVARVREALVPRDDLEHPGPWLFDKRLRTGLSAP
jgi:tRNA U34 5-carboxymethylaminomethyl modifying GTPase MnmE/TrmE